MYPQKNSTAMFLTLINNPPPNRTTQIFATTPPMHILIELPWSPTYHWLLFKEILFFAAAAAAAYTNFLQNKSY